MNFYRANLKDFEKWHQDVCAQEEIGEDGKVGFREDKLAPHQQRTIGYSQPIPHPSNEDDYIFKFGNYSDNTFTELTYEKAKEAGWFLDENEE